MGISSINNQTIAGWEFEMSGRNPGDRGFLQTPGPHAALPGILSGSSQAMKKQEAQALLNSDTLGIIDWAHSPFI